MISKEQLDKFKKQTDHCLFGPSSLGRISLCPASAKETLLHPHQEESIWAAAGTRLHKIMEDLLNELNPYEVIKDTTFENDNERDWCLDNLDFIMPVIEKHYGLSIGLEMETSLSEYGVPEVEGTADVVILSSKRLDVIDWKFGSGVQVFAKDNIQAACYAAGVLPKNFEGEVHIWIAQAPLNHFDEWVVTPEELRRIASLEVWEIVDRAMSPHAHYHPSMEACRFCNVKMGCKARSDFLVEQTKALQVAAGEEKIAMDRYIKLLDAADAIGQAIKDVRAYAEKIIVAGGKFGDYKMVAGRANRKWVDIEEAKEFMSPYEDKAYVKKFVSPAQAEKVDRTLKKDEYFQSLWEKTSGKPILVKGTDKRKAIAYGSNSAFAKYIE